VAQAPDDIESVTLYYCLFGIIWGRSIMSDLRLLRQFVSVYRNRSFRSAADEMGIAQSSVTKRIQHLEQELGLRLFNRTTRTVEPTDSARQLIGKAENALQAASAFQEEARLIAGGALGGIRVGAVAIAAETLIVSSLARLAESHPDLEVDVMVGGSDIYQDLSTGECDLVVGDEANFASSPFAASLRMERLHKEHLVFVHRVGHPAAGAGELAELLAYPLAIPSRYFNENRLFETLAEQTDPPAFPRYRLNSLSACISLAASSDIVALAPQSSIDGLAQAGRSPAISVAGFDTNIDVRLVFVTIARNTPTPAVRAFRNAIESVRAALQDGS
jgi:DNA-binding transcriptional LysR family regulator